MLSNFLVSLLCRFLQILLSFMTLRSLITLLDLESYGAWVTLVSVLGWIALFDFGIGYGLRNRISECFAKSDLNGLSFLISGVLLLYALIAVFIVILFLLLAMVVPPYSINIGASVVLIICAAMTFCFSLGGVLLQAIGAFARLYMLGLITPATWFFYVYFIAGGEVSIYQLAWVYGSLMVLQSFLVFLVGKRQLEGFSLVWPFPISVELISVMKSGFGFFVLQISSLILFMSGNFLSFNLMGPKEAAIYDTLNKIFQFFGIGFSILVSFCWTKISTAKAVGNYRSKRRVFFVLVMASIVVFIFAMLLSLKIGFISSKITSEKVVGDSYSAFCFSLLILFQSLAYSGAVFMNAYEVLKPQIVMAILAIPLFVWMASRLADSGFGVGSIPLACAIGILPSMLVCLIHGYRLSRCS